MKKLKDEDVIFELNVEQESKPIKNNLVVNGFFSDAADIALEDAVQKALDMGNVWVWCAITVTAHWGGFSGRDHLHCCSYSSEEDFTQDMCYRDMRRRALDDLNCTISGAVKKLRLLSNNLESSGKPTGLVHRKMFDQVKKERDDALTRIASAIKILTDTSWSGWNECSSIAVSTLKGYIEPGTPIISVVCPCCDASLEVSYGDDDREISVIGTPNTED